MSNSLRDQLTQLGFKAPAPDKPKPSAGRPARSGTNRPDRADSRRGKSGKPHASAEREPNSASAAAPGQSRRRGPQSGDSAKVRSGRGPEMDLGKAFALRAQQEKQERIAAEQAKQEQARIRREARAKLKEFLLGKSLNADEADIARHFEYGGKIKRIHVTADQLKALNAGTLGVLQNDGRYVLVEAAVLDEAETIFAPAVALRVDPNASAEVDPYADPQYQVPDDIVW